MAIVSKIEGSKLTIKVTGRFDFSAYQSFRSAYQDKDISSLTVVVDLTSADYVDSAALGMMLVLRERLGGKHDSVSIIGGNAQVKEVLGVSRFDQLFVLE